METFYDEYEELFKELVKKGEKMNIYDKIKQIDELFLKRKNLRYVHYFMKFLKEEGYIKEFIERFNVSAYNDDKYADITNAVKHTLLSMGIWEQAWQHNHTPDSKHVDFTGIISDGYFNHPCKNYNWIECEYNLDCHLPCEPFRKNWVLNNNKYFKVLKEFLQKNDYYENFIDQIDVNTNYRYSGVEQKDLISFFDWTGSKLGLRYWTKINEKYLTYLEVEKMVATYKNIEKEMFKIDITLPIQSDFYIPKKPSDTETFEKYELASEISGKDIAGAACSNDFDIFVKKFGYHKPVKWTFVVIKIIIFILDQQENG